MADNPTRKFKFISPGVFVDEIDNSQLPETPSEVGPLVIGRSRKGPANKPVLVESFSDFVQTFGNPVPGGESTDVWREGDLTAPTYAAYAAQAWLRNNAPLTFMRVLGDESTNATVAGKAGWKAGTAGATEAGGGVFALCVWPSGSTSGGPLTGSVAAQFYLNSGRVLLSGSNTRTGVAGFSGSTLYEVPSRDAIQLIFTGSTGAAGETVTVSLNPDKDNFIRKALNTNPTITNSSVTEASSRTYWQGGNYWLGESFEYALEASGTTSTGVLNASIASGALYAAILPMAESLAGFAKQQNDFQGAAIRGTTGWFISQDLTNNFSAYYARNQQPLFRLEALTAGASAQREVKVSISNLKAAVGDYQDYGTFSVLVRSISDTDNRPEIIERWDNLNLNPASPDYIAAKIGDKYQVYDQTNKRNVEYGQYDNQSNYIRVVMDETVDAGAGETRWLPFGVWGPPKYRDVGYLSGSGGWSSNLITPVSGALGAVRTMLAGGNGTAFGDSGHAEANDNLIEMGASDPVAATALLSASAVASMVNDTTLAIIDTAGTTHTFTVKTANDVTTGNNVGIQSAKATGGVAGNEAAAAQFVASINAGTSAATITAATIAGTDGILLIQDVAGASGNRAITNGVAGLTAPASFTLGADAGPLKLAIVNPSVPLRQLSTWGTPRTLKNTYWGAWSGRSATNTFFASQVHDMLRPRSFDVQNAGESADPASRNFDVQGQTLTNVATETIVTPWVFSLDNVGYVEGTTAASGYRYDSDYRKQGRSLSASGSYASTLTAGIDRFTTFLHGGSDGYDIAEPEPFNNARMTATNENNSYALFSLKKAVNLASDPDYVQMNAVTIPGVWRSTVTDDLLDVTQERADALALIDIQYGYTPASETTGNAESRNSGNTPKQASDTLAARSINNSYGATYYPWVRVLDTNSNLNVWMPPSVAALGVLSNTDRLQAPWFAPAGFTRGGLSEGAAGVPVLDVSRRLTSDDRDTLYENNINPIAKFPAEGIVVFGQKTLQQTASALDRINVRRLMIYLKREISFIASRLLFGPNNQDTWDRFLGQAGPLLESVKAEFGIDDFRLVLDSSTTTPDLIDRNIIYAKLLVKPTRAVEYFAIDFVVTNNGAAFED
jgi:hypothetical protein